MSSDSFVFKKFTVYQHLSAHKVGTDAVLLGAWAETGEAKRILDIGTGTGIIALMMGQKSSAQINAIEIDPNGCRQAQENFNFSPWRNRLNAHCISFQDFAKQCKENYDIIISNPPFFIDSMKAQIEERKKARHSDSLPFEELISGVKKILDKNGRFYLILPKKEAETFRVLAEKNGLQLCKLMRVFTKSDQESEKRHMMMFQQTQTNFSESRITIETADNEYTEEYKSLTKDFYLHF